MDLHIFFKANAGGHHRYKPEALRNIQLGSDALVILEMNSTIDALHKVTNDIQSRMEETVLQFQWIT